MQANRSILIADDEPDIREFISYNLAKSGFTVFKANNGIEALES
jgi:DNA-binding response OmpR family regulator